MGREERMQLPVTNGHVEAGAFGSGGNMKRQAHRHRATTANTSWPDRLVADTEAAFFQRDPGSLLDRMDASPPPPAFCANLETFSSTISSDCPSVASTMSPMFAYCQKNFHISDGNLYSVLSPFQARRSSGRPSFLRGRSCVTTCNTSSCTASVDMSSSSTFSSFTSSTRTDPGPPTVSRRHSKLKFHHGDPESCHGGGSTLKGGVHRPASQFTGSRPEPEVGDSRGVDMDDLGSPALRLARFKTSTSPTFVRRSLASSFYASEDEAEEFLSKRHKCRRDRRRPVSKATGGLVQRDVEDDEESFGSLLHHSKWNAEHHRTLGSVSGSGGGGRCRPFGTRREEDLVSPSSSTSSASTWAKDWLEVEDDDEDDIDVDVDGALNLCLADRRTRKSTTTCEATVSSSSRGAAVSSRGGTTTTTCSVGTSDTKRRHSPVEDEDSGDCARDARAFQEFVRQRGFELSRRFLYDEDIDSTKGRMAQPRDVAALDRNEPSSSVLDLSTKARPGKTSCPLSLLRTSDDTAANVLNAAAPPPVVQVCRQDAVVGPQGRAAKGFAPISEMLQNMRLQDDDARQNTWLSRYQAAREKLMGTHPDLFGDWTQVDRAAVDEAVPRPKVCRPDTKPLSSGSWLQQQHHDMDADVHHHTVLQEGSGASAKSSQLLLRPKSWDACAPLRPVTDWTTTTTTVSSPSGNSKRCDNVAPGLGSVPFHVENQLGSAEEGAALPPPPVLGGSRVPLLTIPPDQNLAKEDRTREHQQQQYQQQPGWTLTSTSCLSSSPNVELLGAGQGRGGAGGVVRRQESQVKSECQQVRSKTVSRTSVVTSDSGVSSISTGGPPGGQYPNDISICKFKLIKGVHPVLEKKKSFFVPMPRAASKGSSTKGPLPRSFGTSRSDGDIPRHASGAATGGGSQFKEFQAGPERTLSSSSCGPSSTAGPPGEGRGPEPSSMPFADRCHRTFKIHPGCQEEVGKKLVSSCVAGKRQRRRSRKALVREKLEATFREQGFLIKTQQVSSAEGAVYCKFRQLKKFTRYLYKSWKDHLPKELDDIAKTSAAGAATASASSSSSTVVIT